MGVMETKALPLELKATEAGVIEGYGSVFGGLDSYGDTIEPGAFAKSIKARKPKMLWQHRMDKPIGVWDEVMEDGKGLRLKGRLAMATDQGKEAYELAKMGAMDGLSIGFRTIAEEQRGGARILKEIDLWEVSFVTIPADQAARLTGVKQYGTERAFEAMLREQGFSRWDAKIITAEGWKVWADRRDAEASDLGTDQRDAEVAEELKAIIRNLKGAS
jgi:HK97 family phage prohead protease